MNRSIYYSGEQLRSFDLGWFERDALAAFSTMELLLTGVTTTVVGGLAAAATGPASLSINLAQGSIAQQSAMDSTSFGSLSSDATVVQQVGFAAAQSVTFITSGLSAGQSQWALVEAQFAQVDVIRVGDPTGGLLNYYNSTNPTLPLQGPGGDGQTQPTERQATMSVRVIYGSPATSGSEVPPNVDAGWVGLYLVDLTFGQTTIVQNQILVAGPSVGTGVPSNYPGAPFVAGLLNAHHSGTPGQAPKIDLTAEVQHLLPLANTTASNTSGGGLPVMKLHAGNPNGNVAGNAGVNGANDLCYDTTNQILYVCLTTGSTSTAVWSSTANATTSIFVGGAATGSVNAQVVASTTPAGFTKTSGQLVSFTGLNNTGSTTLNIDGTGASVVQKNTGSGNVNLTGGELNGFVSVLWTGSVYLLQAGVLGQLATLNIGAWLKNDGSGNLTIKNGANLGDDGSGNFIVLPSYLPPVGSIFPYGGTVAPDGYALAQGQAVSRSFQAALFAVFGITFGAGNGTTTFNVPDLRGRVVAGVDGGVNRLTTVTMSSQSIGGVGGGELQEIGVANLPPYTPSGSNSPSSVSVTVPGTGQSLSGAGTGSPFANVPSLTGGGANGWALSGTGTAAAQTFTGNAQGGSQEGLEVVQPTIELSYIIKL